MVKKIKGKLSSHKKELAVGIALAVFLIVAEGIKDALDLWYDSVSMPPIVAIIVGTALSAGFLTFIFWKLIED